MLQLGIKNFDFKARINTIRVVAVNAELRGYIDE